MVGVLPAEPLETQPLVEEARNDTRNIREFLSCSYKQMLLAPSLKYQADRSSLASKAWGVGGKMTMIDIASLIITNLQASISGTVGTSSTLTTLVMCMDPTAV